MSVLSNFPNTLKLVKTTQLCPVFGNHEMLFLRFDILHQIPVGKGRGRDKMLFI